jgi:hypothetical protein
MLRTARGRTRTWSALYTGREFGEEVLNVTRDGKDRPAAVLEMQDDLVARHSRDWLTA